MLSINTNISSLITQRSMKSATNLLNQAVERMSTGYKVNHAKDNAAAYSIITNMDTQISAYQVAEDNCAMGMDMLTTATENLDLIYDKLTRLRDLQEQASNGTYGEQSLKAINSEANALVDEINRLYNTAEYNGLKLFAAEEAQPISMFATPRAAVNENKFIVDPISYTKEQVDAMVTMSQFVNGTTSPTNTYSISTKEELVALAEYVNAGNDTTGMIFVLGDDIDLSSITNWTPIGYSGTFYGTFDGNGHVIKNLTIDTDQNNQGLFGISGAGSTINNLGLDNVRITTTGSTAGGLVGKNSANVSNCYVTGSVNANNIVGGLVAISRYGEFTNCYTQCSVSGNTDIGGLIGYSYDDVNNCYATGNISGDSCIGGLIGEDYGRVLNSYATGSVDGNSNVGGLIGYISVEIRDSYATGNVNGNSNVGGLVGVSGANFTNCYSTGVVTGTTGSNSVTNSTDWDGTEFIYSEASYSGNSAPNLSPPMGGALGGTYAPVQITLQIGSDSSLNSQISVNLSFSLVGIDDLRRIGLDAITDYFAILDDMLSTLSDKQVEYGAVQNRLESALDEISTKYENLVSTRSTLRDADIAEVSSQYIQQQILQQASATLMATANQMPSIALQLI